MTVADGRAGAATADGRARTSSRRSPPGAATDILAEIAATGLGAHRRRRRGDAPAAPDRRTGSRRPGLHLIAEIKRSSPSAGRIAAADEDIVARARAYEAGGAAAISVLCEPHWFGGLGRRPARGPGGRRASRSWPRTSWSRRSSCRMLRAAGADLVLLLAVLHPAQAAGPARRPGARDRSRAARRGPRRARAGARARHATPG